MRKFLTFLLILFVARASAQKHQVSGLVLDGETITLLSDVKVNDEAAPGKAIKTTQGKFNIEIPSSGTVKLKFQRPGYETEVYQISEKQDFITIFLDPDTSRAAIKDQSVKIEKSGLEQIGDWNTSSSIKAYRDETYDQAPENKFKKTHEDPFSSFTLNANHASFCNIRRFIQNEVPVPPQAVRIEEMVNYYLYQDPLIAKKNEDKPLTQSVNVVSCPWHKGHWLMQVAVQGQTHSSEKMPPLNLVLLIDVSGSMNRPDKLPLLKTAFKELAKQLRPQDTIAIVVYAGNVSIALPPTSGDRKIKILNVIHNLNAGGSTAGGAGIETAFKLAKQHFIPKGINRVIIATDGDFNVGKSSDSDMRRLVSHYHGWGIYLTCIGVGTGNYKDSKLETLARWGQGNFAYLDNEMEAQRIFSSTYGATMVPLALNARLKVIFNPNVVQSYRLIGYEKRMDGSKNDTLLKEPGGEIGSGQRILACYEIMPSSGFNEKGRTRKWIAWDEETSLATVILQYQSIEDTTETVAIKKIPLQVKPFEETEDSWQFGASVTLFGMLLRHSDHIGEGNFDMAEKIARRAKDAVSKDDYKDYIKLVKKAARQFSFRDQVTY